MPPFAQSLRQAQSSILEILKLPAPRCRESSRQGKGLFVVVRSLTHAASCGECARYSCSIYASLLSYFNNIFYFNFFYLLIKLFVVFLSCFFSNFGTVMQRSHIV